MSENFDYPPASNNHPPRPQLSPHAQARLNLNAQLRHLRDLISEFQDEDGSQRDLALQTLNREVEDTTATRLLDYRRILSSIRSQQAERGERVPHAMQQALDTVEPHSMTAGSRRPRTSREDELSTTVGARRLADMNGLNALQLADERLRAAANPRIQTLGLLDINNGTADPRSGEPLSERQSSRRRTKRVKLDSDDKREGLRGFSYGHYGQVVPGTLEMEIISCDGGAYGNGRSSWPENILLNDNSVFSARSDRCNVILRHQGQTPFCLKKLVIKAPRSGFDGPAGIREGMVFVSMASDELLARTARYHMVYSCRPLRPPLRRRSSQNNAQRYISAFRASLQSTERTVLIHPDQSYYENGSATSADREQTSSREASPDFRITLEQDDKSEDESMADHHSEDLATNAEGVLPDESPEVLYPIAFDSDDSEEEATETSDLLLDEIRRQVRSTMGAEGINPGLRGRLLPNIMATAVEPQNNSLEGTAGLSIPEKVLNPHARFFIKRDKDAVRIKFDPPVSGQFVLVKLWSPFGNGTVAVQNITAHGYAGPRFFPSLQFR
ncbi:hypothetical protein PRK78_002077 [Emydomyces testavorans]|uniref:Uncharacterized protein n=1 Tax=Emydomyces testavorans TaxID=2070801 RepID=A0AAF0DED5_9EURO|nr:hypothetical protein PRK78_002077 [Emydomyces testavorans]